MHTRTRRGGGNRGGGRKGGSGGGRVLALLEVVLVIFGEELRDEGQAGYLLLGFDGGPGGGEGGRE